MIVRFNAGNSLVENEKEWGGFVWDFLQFLWFSQRVGVDEKIDSENYEGNSTFKKWQNARKIIKSVGKFQ